jgi:hypothetical protein
MIASADAATPPVLRRMQQQHPGNQQRVTSAATGASSSPSPRLPTSRLAQMRMGRHQHRHGGPAAVPSSSSLRQHKSTRPQTVSVDDVEQLSGEAHFIICTCKKKYFDLRRGDEEYES